MTWSKEGVKWIILLSETVSEMAGTLGLRPTKTLRHVSRYKPSLPFSIMRCFFLVRRFWMQDAVPVTLRLVQICLVQK